MNDTKFVNYNHSKLDNSFFIKFDNLIKLYLNVFYKGRIRYNTIYKV